MNISIKYLLSQRRALTKALRLLVLVIVPAMTLICPSLLCAQAQGTQSKQPTNASSSANKSNKQTKSSTQDKARATSAAVPEETMLFIMRAEDERRWDAELGRLLFDRNARVRHRAALAAGRIGDEAAVSALVSLLQTDRETSVRSMAAFALGEIESALAADALLNVLDRSKSSEVRARAVEALGKIIAALPKKDEERGHTLGAAILKVLNQELERSPKPDRMTVLLGLTAALRARPAGAGIVIAHYLNSTDARVRADAANALARLRSKDANTKLRELLLGDQDAIVRANAARALGAAEDKEAFEPLVSRGINDADLRVRVSAIRALAALKDARAATPLLQRAATLSQSFRGQGSSNTQLLPREINELLEIATALGRSLANTNDEKAVTALREWRESFGFLAPEIEIAFARIAPGAYLRTSPLNKLYDDAVRARLRQNWRMTSSLAQGLGEIGGITAAAAGSGIITLQADAQIILRALLDDASMPALAVPDVLRALAVFKSNDLGEILRKQLSARDLIVRATAAELLGELPPDEGMARSLASALPLAMRDEQNDAVLAILDALGKQKSAFGNDTIKTALEATDHLVRRRAVALLRANEAGDFQSRINTVTTRNQLQDYQRALALSTKTVRAIVITDAGQFTIELLSEDAPLTVDNFIKLARSGFFNGVMIHRVVPNFVVQDGDPRGDGNGGPPYQIRCEINQVAYDRGAVGMALSGKDTGGSQWFVTHSPQPHLDGGYTVFGRVINGMDVVDRIVRGDVIRSVEITESARAASRQEKKQHSSGETTKKRRTEN